MKTTKTFTDDHQVRVTAEFDQETFDGFKRKAARKIAQKTRIPGFRPGKAPYNMILSHIGEGAVFEEAIDLMLDEIYPKVLEQEDIQPYGPGNLENIPSQEPPVFEFLIPLAPETELKELETLKLPYTPVSVTEADVDAFIKELQRDAADLVPVEGPAEEGHIVYMTVTATDVNPADADNAVLIDDAPKQVQIPTEDEEEETEWPFKGFSRDLIGARAEDDIEITYEFPENETLGDFSGKTIRFLVYLQSVKTLELPPLDENFLEKMGNFSSVEELRKDIRENLETERMETYDTKYYLELVDTLRKSAIMKYPPQLLEDEEHEVLHRIEHDLEHRGINLDVYLKVRKIEKEQFIEEEVKPTAKDRIERSLVMDAIMKHFDLQITENDMKSEIIKLVTSLFTSGEYDQLEKDMGKRRFSEAISAQANLNATETSVRRQLRLMASPESIVNEDVPDEVAIDAESDDLEADVDLLMDKIEALVEEETLPLAGTEENETPAANTAAMEGDVSESFPIIDQKEIEE